MAKPNNPKLLTKPGVYGYGEGLYLQVRDAKRQTWIYRYSLHGKARWMGLGALADVSLAEARTAAQAARAVTRTGADPIEDRRVKAAEAAAREGLNTFAEVAEAYVSAHEASWRNPKHRQQWRNTLATYAEPVLGKLPVASVDVGAVMRVLTPIWHDKTETASRVRGRIEAVLDYAKARGWRTEENPARWRGHLDNLLPQRGKIARVEHHAALPWQQIGAFMADLAKQDGAAALALRFAILTAARTGEVIGATWEELDTAGALWTVPAARMKAGREHRSPLSGAALGVLRQAAKIGTPKNPASFVFPGQGTGKPLSNMALLMLLRRMERGDLTAHGFRSTFRDWCAEASAHPREIAEAALAHTLRDKTEAAYQRGDLLEKRRKLMADWATFALAKKRSRASV